MRLFNIIDGLNELFEDTSIKQVVLRLTRNPVIWNFLGEPQNFKLIRETLSHDPARWTISGVIESAAGLFSETGATGHEKSFSGSGAFMSGSNSVSELSAYSLWAKDYIKENSFGQWLKKIPVQNASEENLWSWAAILSEVFPVLENPPEALSEFICEGNIAATRLLAYALHSDRVIAESLLNNLDVLFADKDLSGFVALINYLDFLGDFELTKKIAENYLDLSHPEKSLRSFDNISFDDLLKTIAKNRNLIFISQKAGKNAVSDDLHEIGKELLSKLLNETGISNYDPAIFEKFSGFQNEKYVLNGTKSLLKEKIDRVNSLLPTYPESAKPIAVQIFQIAKQELSGKDSTGGLGYSLRHEIIELIKSCNLTVECAELVEKFLIRYPDDIQLMRIAAELFHEHGNHAKAVQYYQLLNLLDTLSRAEKVKFAESLAFIENSHSAYEVRSSVNLIELEDTRILCRYAYYAGLQEEIDKILEKRQMEISEWPLAKFLSQKYISNGNQDDTDWEQIWPTLSTNEDMILFIDLLEKNNKTSLVPNFLNKLLNESADFSGLTIKLARYYLERGDTSTIRESLMRAELSNAIKQKEFEDGIDLLIQNGLIEKASQWLNRFENSWRLSPTKNLLQAEVFLYGENFKKAEQLLNKKILYQEENEKSLLLYSLALLNAHPNRFPIGIKKENICKLKEIEEKFKPNFDYSNLTLRILRIYLNDGDRIGKFEKELAGSSSLNQNETWRINAAIANEYFNQGRFDLAIQYFKEVERFKPFDFILLRRLLECYLRLKLSEEAEVILHRLLAVEGLTTKDLICLSFDHLMSEEWVSFLDTQIMKFPDSKEIMLLVALSSCRNGKFEVSIESTKDFLEDHNLNLDDQLIAAQILTAAGDHSLAERVIEIIFSQSANLEQAHFLTAALIYESMENYSKALVMLNHLQPFDKFLSGFKLDLMIKNGNHTDAAEFLQEINPESRFEFSAPSDLPLIDMSSWQKLIDDQSYFEKTAANVWITNKDLPSALKILEEGFKHNPSDEELAYLVMDIAKLINRTDLLDEILIIFDGKEIHSSNLICSLGEAALMRGLEVLAAHYLSEIIDESDLQPKVKALQSILLKRNGNITESKSIYRNLLNEQNLNSSISSLYSGIQDNQLWLASLAFEMDDFSKALDISQEEIAQFGQVSGLVNFYLRSLLGLLRQNVFFEKLNCFNQVGKLSDEQLSLFSLIENGKKEKNYAEFDGLAYRLCKAYINQENFEISDFLELASSNADLRDLLYLSFLKNGYEKTELEFSSKLKNQQDLIFFAAILVSEHPAKSFELIQGQINLLSNNPIHLALLGKIHFALANYSEAYAAITLALNINPEEYGWEILAGEISQKKGDMIAAIEHFERANRLSKKSILIEQLNDLHILTGNEQAIPIMESKFAVDSGNSDLALKIATLCLNFNKPGKAALYFETASKLNPGDHKPLAGLCKVSAQVENFDKALEYADKGLQLCNRDLDLLLIKTDLIKRTLGFQEAKNFLENQSMLKDDISGDLQASLADLIYDMQGLDECLAFIASKDLQNSQSIKFLTTRVKYLMVAGDSISAKENLDKMLNEHPDNAEINALMGEYYRIQGDLDQAIGHYLRAINLDTSNEKYFLNLFEIYNDQRESESAKETLRSGMKAIPYSVVLPIRLAKFYLQHGLVEQASEIINRVLQLRPRDEEAGALKNLIKQQRLIVNHKLELITE